MLSNIIFDKLKLEKNKFVIFNFNSKLQEKYKNLKSFKNLKSTNNEYNFQDSSDPEKNKNKIIRSFFSNYQRLESIEKYKNINCIFFMNDNDVNSFINFLTISIILYLSSKYYLKPSLYFNKK